MPGNQNSSNITILIAEDDEGHAELIQDHLRDAGVYNPMLRFRDGQEVLDFLYEKGDGPKLLVGHAYLLLLDIRMPKVDGVEVLRIIKADARLKNIPVIMLTTTDDPREVESCYRLGCSCYISKPVDYAKFSEMLRRLGLFIVIVKVPEIEEAEEQ